MNSPWPAFAYSELRCRCGQCDSDGREMDAAFMATLQQLRDDYGQPLVLSSAYRCPQHPEEAHKSAPGAHALGLAVDIRCQGEQALLILHLSLALPFTGFGIQQKGAARFIHLDMATAAQLPRPALWSY